jgi:hypothetical protein
MFRMQVFRAGLRIQKANVRQASTKSAQETAQQALGAAQKQAEKALEVSKQIGGRVGERVGGWLGCEWGQCVYIPQEAETVWNSLS